MLVLISVRTFILGPTTHLISCSVLIRLRLAMSSRPPSYSNPDSRAIGIIGAYFFILHAFCMAV